MAIRPQVRYPDQFDTGDPGYPHGRARNVDTEGDGTGTPWEKDLVNDFLGFQQALLTSAGVTPSGTPDSATASQYLQSFYRLLGRADGWGALGDDATDDTAALQAALTALGAFGGRRELHLVDGRTYRHTGLSVPGNVDIIFHGANLNITHATNNHLTYAAGSTGATRLRLVGGQFGATVANTSAAVRITSTVGLKLEGCSFGEATANMNGKFIDATGSVANVVAVDCSFRSRASAAQIDIPLGFLRLVRCTHTVPTTYAASCILIGTAEAWVESPFFSLDTHNSGSMACIEVTGAATVLHVRDADFYNDGSDAAPPVALKWGDVACKIVEQGSTFTGLVTPYSGTVVLAEGSRLSLQEHGTFSTTDEAYVIPDDYRAVSIAGTWGTNPTLGMPAMRFPGQECELQFYQESVVDLTAFGLNALGPDLSPLDGANIKTGRMKVMRDHFQDEWRWFLMGDWSTMFARAHEVG